MKKFDDFKKEIEKYKKLYEHAVSNFDADRINRLKESKDIKGLLKEADLYVSKLRNNLKDYSFKDIVLVRMKKNNVYNVTVKYKDEENINIDFLEKIFINKDDVFYELICNKVFGIDGLPDFYLDIDIDINRLNKIDIINELPNIFRNLGLGKKIYKALIFKFNYISSNIGDTDPSIESNMVWSSIFQDKEIFSFSHNDNLISFANTCNEQLIIEKLTDFFSAILDNPQKDEYVLDEDIFIKYPDIFKGTELEKLL